MKTPLGTIELVRSVVVVVVVVLVVVVAQQHVHRVVLVGSTGQSIDGEMQFSGGGRDEGIFQDSVATFVHGIDVGLADVQQIFRHFVVPLRQTAHQWRQALPIADVRTGPCEILMKQIQLSKVSQTSVKHQSNISQTSVKHQSNIDKHRQTSTNIDIDKRITCTEQGRDHVRVLPGHGGVERCSAVVVVLHEGGRGIQNRAPLQSGWAVVGVHVGGGGGGC
jgi:hypothetical protein